MRHILYIIFLSTLVLTGCRKDIEKEDTQVIILVGDDVETNLHGRVVTKSGSSVAEASVEIGDNRTFTNIDGYFYLPNLQVPEDGFAMEVSSPLFNKSIRRIIPQAGTNTYEEVILQLSKFNNLLDSSVPNFVNDTTSNVEIRILNNSLVDNNGDLYKGLYQANIVYYDPTKISTLRAMPGNLDGVDKDGNKVTLGSLGMFYVEVLTENGEPLFLAEGKTAAVSMRAPASYGIDVPSDVPIWRLDDASSIWIQTDINNTFSIDADIILYRFDISEFNFWNCDIPLENTCLNGIITDNQGRAIENRFVQLTFTEEGIDYLCVGGNTNSKGEFEAKVPRDKDILLSVYDENCNDIIYNEELGSFSGDKSTINITANLTEKVQVISGVVIDCDGNSVENATAFLIDEQNKVRTSTQTSADGVFTLHDVCYGSIFTIKVLDLNNFTIVESQLFESFDEDQNIGEIILCLNSDTEFINVESGLGFITFNNPNLVVATDSLVLIAETNQGSFLLVAYSFQEGINDVDHLNVRVGDNEVTCTSQFTYTDCSETVVFDITSIDPNTQVVTGTITGVLFSGDLSDEETILANDVNINFVASY